MTAYPQSEVVEGWPSPGQVRFTTPEAKQVKVEATARTIGQPGWYLHDPHYLPKTIHIAMVSTSEELSTLCGLRLSGHWTGCTIRKDSVCTVYIRPVEAWRLNCLVRHELRHCTGWNHVYSNDDCD